MKTLFILFLNIGLSLCILISQPKIIKLWPQGIPGSMTHPGYKEAIVTIETGAQRIMRVTDPTISVYFPSREKSAGTAIVVCPGGGYARLAMDNEGSGIAAWLNEAGITCIILKYRLPNDTIMKEKSIGPLQDVQEAIRITRRHAKEWNIDPSRIGVMGFSAGGHLAASASTLFNDRVYDCDTTSSRPDFSVLVYPVISMQPDIMHKGSRTRLLGENPDPRSINRFSCDQQVSSNTPAAFIVHAADDKSVPVQNSISYFQALQKMSIPAELHIFENGGHGFGLAKNRTTSESRWTDLCITWLRMHKLL